MKIAVVGGGVFGTTAAMHFAWAGHQVDLYEKQHGLLLGASRANQGRLHHGYHYPRCPTADLRRHAARFSLRFPGVVLRQAEHYYCVARHDSKLTGEQYLSRCDRLGLPYRLVTPAPVCPDAVDACVAVSEAFIDIPALRATLRRNLAWQGVRLHLGTAVDSRELTGYDRVINATYGRGHGQLLKFEVCETAIISAGPRFRRKSFVVMDGPFISLDPIAGQDRHLLYDVVHSVHSSNIGYEPEIPAELAPLLDRGPVQTPLSRVGDMLDTARRFLRGLERVEYRASQFTVRAVLPDVEDTDERPTLVHREGNHVTILSGKIDMAVWAAQRAVEVASETELVA